MKQNLNPIFNTSKKSYEVLNEKLKLFLEKLHSSAKKKLAGDMDLDFFATMRRTGSSRDIFTH